MTLWSVLDQDEAVDAHPMSELHQTTLDGLVWGIKSNAVLSGCGVSERGAGANGSVDVASGVIYSLGVAFTFGSTTNVVLEAAHLTLGRIDMIVMDPAGSITYVKGTAATAPKEPEVDYAAGNVLLAKVYRAPGVDTVDDADIGPRQVPISDFYPLKSTLTTNGDMYTRQSGAPARLAVGSASSLLGVSGGLPAWVAQTYLDHGGFSGNADDDHTQYGLLAGRSGGQTFIGGTAASNNLRLQSTAHATKGNVYFGSVNKAWYGEASTPGGALELHKDASPEGGLSDYIAHFSVGSSSSRYSNPAEGLVLRMYPTAWTDGITHSAINAQMYVPALADFFPWAGSFQVYSSSAVATSEAVGVYGASFSQAGAPAWGAHFIGADRWEDTPGTNAATTIYGIEVQTRQAHANTLSLGVRIINNSTVSTDGIGLWIDGGTPGWGTGILTAVPTVQWSLIETGEALPSGRHRIVTDGGAFRIDQNTHSVTAYATLRVPFLITAAGLVYLGSADGAGSSNVVGVGSNALGFYATSPIAKPSGNALTALSNLGLITSPTLPAASVSSGAALTKSDDTNVTATLGGSPTTALIAAASITLGWTGTLAAARLNSSVVQSVVNDTNVTGSIATQALTLGWTGTLAVARGGTATATMAWTAYTPTITSGTGTFTTVSGAGRYLIIGKTMWITVTVTVTTNGTAATSILIPLPSGTSSGRDHVLAGRGTSGGAEDGLALTGRIAASNTSIAMKRYDGTYPGVDSWNGTVTGVIELA